MAIITGNDGANLLSGDIDASVDDQIYGLGGNDQLSGLTGNDLLDGGPGIDTLRGGVGDDTYVIDSLADTVVENNGEGADTVLSAASGYILPSAVENLVLTGTALSGTGNGLDNILVGNGLSNQLNGGSGDDVLDGGTGADQMNGGADDDLYIVDNTGDTIGELVNGGIDTVQSSVNFSLAALSQVEHLILAGAALNGTGNNGANTLTGNALANRLAGNGGNDVLNGGAGADMMIGGDGDDTYFVDDLGDSVVEQAATGADLVYSAISFDLAAKGANVSHLTLLGNASLDARGNELDNALTGNAGANTLEGRGGNDVLDGGGGADLMLGGLGDDVYFVDDLGDQVSEAAGQGDDTVYTQLDFDLAASASEVENLVLQGAALMAIGNALDNHIQGNQFDNFIDGGVGADTLDGGGGDDLYQVDDSNDVVVEEFFSGGLDTVHSTASFDLAANGANVETLLLLGDAAINGTGNGLSNHVTGNGASNVLDGGAGDDVLDGGAGPDQLTGGLGDDTFIVDDAGDLVTELAGEGLDLVRSIVSFNLATRGTSVEYLSLFGDQAINGTGNSLDNVLVGNGAVNLLEGGDGDDSLDGGAGADTLKGGQGDDLYYVDDVGDRAVESSGQGLDIVYATVSFALNTNGVNVEQLYLLGSALNGTGNPLDNVLAGNELANVLNGGGGADQMYGGAGNDSYLVDNPNDQAIEYAGDGVDRVTATVSFRLDTQGEFVENLVLGGNAALNGTGNALDNSITGNSGVNVLDGGLGNDLLDGRGGADLMVGGGGNDTFIVDVLGDQVLELQAGGTDQVRSYIDYSLADFGEVENLTLLGAAILGTGNALGNKLTGNAGANILEGGDGNDILDGAAGADVMSGGAGDDQFIVDNLGDVLTEVAGGGRDTVKSSLDFDLGLRGQQIENLTLTGALALQGVGNALDNVLTGNGAANVLHGADGNDYIDGGAGADQMDGGAGDDTFIVDRTSDVLVELVDGGVDLVRAIVSFDLAASGARIENLTLTGGAALTGSGNDLDNILIGNGASNTLIGRGGDDLLDGQGGADTMAGGTGDDRYVVNHAGDSVAEESGAGTDTVQSYVSFNLATSGANIEHLTLLGSGNTSATGNALANLITGNAGNNSIDGGAGADTLAGGLGNDNYTIDDVGDLILEASGGGIDTAKSSVSFNLETLGQQVEYLVLTGTLAIDGGGNALDNRLTGNGAANTLDGGLGNDWLDGSGGADRMLGGFGDDTYVVNTVADVVVELADQGIDTIRSYTHLNLGTFQPQVENLVLLGTVALNASGNALDNQLTGNVANNTLDGAGGADLMAGLAGNDQYVVDHAGDMIIEAADGGLDIVRSSVTFNLATHGANVETLFLTGSAGIDGRGDANDNTLVGNGAANRLIGEDGDDWLDGAGGADTLIGGDGDDLFVIDHPGDVVLELADEGTDTVRTTSSFDLSVRGAHVENLELIGAAAIDGSGNELANRLTGNAAANVLNGGANDDVLDGAGGVDLLIGGAGDDTYVVDQAAEQLVEYQGEGIDQVESSVSFDLSVAASQVEHLRLLGTLALNGAGNALDNRLDGNDAANSLVGGGGADALYGHGGDDALFVDGFDTRIDGGAGIDTLHLVGAGQSLFLFDALTVTGIERVALGNAGNSLTVGASALVDSVGNATMTVDGGSSDRLVAVGAWTHVGDFAGYARYTREGATLEVALAIDRSGVGQAAPSLPLAALNGSDGYRIGAVSDFEWMGTAVAGGLDVNGDGYSDYVVTAPLGSPDGVFQAGNTFVVFGSPTSPGPNLDVSVLDGVSGFRIDGAAANDRSGRGVALGDVNGDGLADVIVSGYAANNGGGETYVIFGATSFAPVIDPMTLDGSNGLRLRGGSPGLVDQSGLRVASGGDFNADGFDDLVIAANFASSGAPGEPADARHAYLVFGRADGFPAELDIGELDGVDGARLDGAQADALGGVALSLLGDVNGDGFDDVYVGAQGGFPFSAGVGYVLFGQGGALDPTVDLTTLNGQDGFRLVSGQQGDHLGMAVSSAGDFNGDGIDDLLIGARGAAQYAGVSYLVYGRTGGFGADLDLDNLDAAEGFRFEGRSSLDSAGGMSVAGAGDIDGDGFDDLVIGLRSADVDGTNNFGAATVLFGAAEGFGARVPLDDLHGLVFTGGAYLNYAGAAVSSAGDINGDGFHDLLIGAPGATDGRAYMVFGRDFRQVGHLQGGGDDDLLTGTGNADRMLGALGDDRLAGGGGRDVLLGGAGDDVLEYDGVDLRVDGGAGFDTLTLALAGQSLDLTLTGMTGGSLRGLEAIDLGESGDNLVSLRARDVLDLPSSGNTLRVLGDAGDSLSSLGQGWTLDAGGVVIEDGVRYNVYHAGAARLMVDEDLTVGLS